ncbi:RHS repeat-associated core domain-containing protein [Fusarium heterosporum]|uniref:RHS repeat-associated core domain-containing protein n=1 Tax=Fusarium heterosporum TaxID=42747 RepID=A0A8H5TYA6_FUSHE|nr:RHS repeat-associated core domain-containing protein [Fusarium heterosporum]
MTTPSIFHSTPKREPMEGPEMGPGIKPVQATSDGVSGSSGQPSGNKGPQLISTQKPTGGGAIKSIDEKFSALPATGAFSLTIPIPSTEARPGGTPSLALGYSSGGGNGPFGLGWTLNLGQISRRVSKGRPRYEDAHNSDVFILADQEDLVPMSEIPDHQGDYVIRKYRPRSEGAFARIEQLTNKNDPSDAFWCITSKDNVLSVYGRDDNSKIQLAKAGSAVEHTEPKIFSWLLCETYDCHGNTISYVYKAEDDVGIDRNAINEHNRTSDSRSAQRYIKSVRYGNTAPMMRSSLKDTAVSGSFLSQLPSTEWLFQLVFDYGDHHPVEPVPDSNGLWLCRKDPFSSYRQGFEVRTYRLCHRVLMFHRFPDELSVDALLVHSLDLSYREQPTISFLTKATSRGYMSRKTDDTLPGGVGPYFSRALPSLDFEYTQSATSESLARSSVKKVDSKSLENLPEGVSGRYQWLDLHGEGLSGVFSAQGDAWFYKRNLSSLGSSSSSQDGVLDWTATLGAMEVVHQLPNVTANERPRFVDLAGDGSLDFADMTGPVKGFYSATPFGPDMVPGQWDNFRPFKSWPAGVDVDSPDLRFIDLTGDGIADILVTEQQVFTFYPSLGVDGYGEPRRIYQEGDEERGPRVLFSDPSESIYFADMSGDGTSDLCRIRNGEVSFWPNLGYGVFGAKVAMCDSPYFDRPEAFTQRRVLLADIDGSGTTDIIYLGSEAVTLYFNNSGNGWAKPEHLPSSFLPRIDIESGITATDILGNGTACLVWSSSAATNSSNPLQYIDFHNGIKPHLLIKTNNNVGKETNLSYLPSTTFYLRDERDGSPWVTRLPFPVQCLESVRTYDAVGRSYHTARYAYHHGYYDRHDREFRGFGMVEQWDTEEFEISQRLSPMDVANVDQLSFSAPVLTKRWYHTGAYLGHESLQRLMARGYAGANDLTTDEFKQYFVNEVLRDVIPDAKTLTAAEMRDATRTLKGSLLREELFALDGSVKAQLPLQIKDYGFNVKVLQRHGVSDVAVCQSFQREQISYSSERAMNDHRIQHSMVLGVDEYGNILNSVQIAYGRETGKTALTGVPKRLQETTCIVLDCASYTNVVNDGPEYRTPLQSSVSKYELFGIDLGDGETRFHPDDFGIDKFSEIPFESTIPKDALIKRVMARKITLYRKNDLTDLLSLGRLESMALEGSSYTLCFTPELLKKYQRDGKSLVPSPEDTLCKRYKYESLEGQDQWWLPTAQLYYHNDSAATPSVELESAKKHFFTPVRMTDPFGNSSLIELDSYNLNQKSSTDALGNISQYVYDYRTMKLVLETDPNGNRTAYIYDCCARLVASALMGKIDQNIGDSLEGIHPEMTEHEAADFAAEPLKYSPGILKGATVRYVYDLDQYSRGKGPSTPSFASTLSRATHVHEVPQGSQSKISCSFDYFDSFGRAIQTKTIAERDPSTPLSPRWVGSAWRMLDNKGNSVRIFNPFFDDTHAFKSEHRAGVSPYFMYDALGRLVATATPSHTWTKVVYGSWETLHYDSNDTVLMDPRWDEDVGNYFQRLPDQEYLPSWYDQRENGALGTAEKDAADKTAKHSNTPTTLCLDSMGNEFLWIKDNGDEKFVTYRVFDAKGLSRETRDAKGRLIERKSYDMAGNDVLQETMDVSNLWTLHDVMGRAVLMWRGQDQTWRKEYDAQGRETKKFLLEGEKAEILYEMKTYGESESGPEERNLRGQLFRVYDQAGIDTYLEYDFTDVLITSQRQLAVEYRSTLDWSVPVDIALQSDTYTERTHQNALSQVTYSQASDGSASRYTYNDAGLLDMIESNIRGEKSSTGNLLWKKYVIGVDYNELSFATAIYYGNGQEMINAFDPLTLRLKKRQTLFSSTARAPKVLQSLDYTYDPSGNITFIRNDAQQDIFFRNRVVSPDANYSYDPTYRLIESSGREQLDNGSGSRSSNMGPAYPGAFQTFDATSDAPRDGMPLNRYIESYKYDSANNILSIQHDASGYEGRAWTRTYTYEEKNALEPESFGNRVSSTRVGSTIERYGYGGRGGQFGCLTSMPHLANMEWDAMEQLRTTTRQVVRDGVGPTPERTWYVYDSQGTRIRKIIERQESQVGSAISDVPRKLKEWLYFGEYELFCKYAGDGTTIVLQNETFHVNGSNGRIALLEDWTGDGNPSRLVRYQICDHLDAVSIEVDENGILVSYEEYSAYGNTTFQMQDSQRPKRFRWSSKERDKENGLYYSEARYYAPWLGRWVSADPAGIEDDMNVFTYVSCKPTAYSDPTGLGKTPKNKKHKTPLKPVTKQIQKPDRSDNRNALRHRKIHEKRDAAANTAPIQATEASIAEGEASMRNLLAVTWERTQLHHVYPQEYRAEFNEIGIDVDNFTVSLTDEVHRICTVGGTANGTTLGKWNDRWDKLFFREQSRGYYAQMTGYEKLKPAAKEAVRMNLQISARTVCGIIMAEYGLRHLHKDGEPKFLDYNYVQNMKEDSERSQIKSANLVHHEDWETISSVSFNAAASESGTASQVSSLQFKVSIKDFASLTGKEKKLLSKLMASGSVTPPSSVSTKGKKKK